MARSPRSPPVPEALLAEDFQRAVLAFLAKERSITEALRAKMLGWRYAGGFSAHNQVRVVDSEGPMKLAGYMIRAPMSLEKMTYDPATGTSIWCATWAGTQTARAANGRRRSTRKPP